MTYRPDRNPIVDLEILMNGGVQFSHKAHAVCACCTEFCDYQRDLDRQERQDETVARFRRAAFAYFIARGWHIDVQGGRTYCPTHAPTPRKKKEKR